jgi:hypothetical protein
MRTSFQFVVVAWILMPCFPCCAQAVQPRVIELAADSDSRYREAGKAAPTVEVFAGEQLVLRIRATRAKEVARDGSIHGLALLDKNLEAVRGWRFFLRPGLQEIPVIAPTQPGRYRAVCTVICSDMHDGMVFTLVVLDTRKKVGK